MTDVEKLAEQLVVVLGRVEHKGQSIIDLQTGKRTLPVERAVQLLTAFEAKVRDAALEEALASCEHEETCYADNHRAHDNLCHRQDIAAIRALKKAGERT